VQSHFALNPPSEQSHIMNDIWSRYPWYPPNEPADPSAGPYATPPTQSGGILGKLGQNLPSPPAKQLWNDPWSYRSLLEQAGDSPEFLNAWRHIYSMPLRPTGWLPIGLAPFPPNIQASLVSAPVATPALAVRNQPPTDTPNSDPWQRDTSTNFAPTMRDLNANDREAAPQVRAGQGGRSFRNAVVPEQDATQPPRAQTSTETLSDFTPDNLWIPGADYAADGHHTFPRANYRDMRPETQKVFDEAKTGKLLVRSINGRRHEFDEFHRQYNAATDDLKKSFMKENNIVDEYDLTPDHARAVLKAVDESQDPRILTYRNFIRLFRLFPWLRSGRGTE